MTARQAQRVAGGDNVSKASPAAGRHIGTSAPGSSALPRWSGSTPPGGGSCGAGPDNDGRERT